MGKVAGVPGCLDFIGDFEGESLPTLAPGSGVAGIVPVKEERGGQRLQIRSEVHSGGRLADAAFVAGDGDNHASSFCIFVCMKMQTDKNTKIRGGKQGQRSTLYLIHTKDQTLSEKMPGG